MPQTALRHATHLTNNDKAMNNTFFAINPNALPQVSALDSCSHKPPYVHFKRKYHEYILYYITSGELYIEEDGLEYHLDENSSILLDPTRTHVGTRTSTYEFCYFHFIPGYGEGRYEEFSSNQPQNRDKILFPKYHKLKSTEAITACRQLCDNVHAISIDGKSLKRQKASALLHMLMLEIADDMEAGLHETDSGIRLKASTAREVEWYLRHHYMEDFDSDTLGSRFGYNFDHLNRLFKKETGDTIYHYLTMLRCLEAQKLLRTGYYTNAEIADRVGFSGSEHFSHIYKKYMGHSPRTENI